MRSAFISMLCSALFLTACRDGAEAYINSPIEWTPEGAGFRLTYNPEDDRTPAWTEAGDSIYYVARAFTPFPLVHGVLLSAPATGGAVAPVLRAIQLEASESPMLAAPVLSPSADRLAFLELGPPVEYGCLIITCPTSSAEDTAYANPTLGRAVLRVRSSPGTGPDSYQRPISFEGVVHDSMRHPFNLEFVTIHDVHPFHRLYNRDRSHFFRPTWSPDGQQLAFSDGLRIHIWRLGEQATTVLPHSQDGIWPAWSPDGATIAFTRLSRAAATAMVCECRGVRFVVVGVHEKTLYDDPGERGGTLVLVRPDGSGLRELGEGDAPAWLPDGRRLVATRQATLQLIDVQTGSSQIIPGTTNGFEPAVSPDGRSVAFARATQRRAAGFTDRLEDVHDIWVVRLP